MTHNFTESLRRSHSYSDAPWWRQVYTQAFPNFDTMADVREKSQAQEDGIDRLVFLTNKRVLTVDEKVREKDWGDFCLEYWSDRDRRVLGWVAKDLTCDYIAYAYAPSQTCYLLPFLQLRRAWREHGRAWVTAAREARPGYKIVEAFNETDGRQWVTESVAVPRDTVLAALTDAMEVHWQ